MRAFTCCGTGSASSATGSRTPSCAASATACRSTRSASPRRSPRTTCRASCSRRSASPCRSDARARAIQLPAWNEALGLPRPWDQQWSLRIQQVLAFETDLLEYERHLRRLHGDRGQDRRAGRGRRGRARRGARPRRCVRGHRRAEAPPGHARPNGSGASRPASSSWSGSTASPRPSSVAARRRRVRSCGSTPPSRRS